MTAVYTISGYDTDIGLDGGVMWVASSKEKAFDIVKQYARDNDVTIKEIEEDIFSTAIYTTDRIYHIEKFTIDDY